MSILDTADKLFTGELSVEQHHPFQSSGQLAEVAPGVAFVDAFANSAVFDTDDGLVVVDTSGVFHAKGVHETVRRWSGNRLDTAIFTHGHIDHVFGVELYEEDARTNGWAPPRVVAHELIVDRFDRYKMTAGYNAVINQRQFKAPGLRWPMEYRYPDETYRTTLTLTIAGEPFELHHARGETDDGTWVWVPERRILCAGDLFIWASPNCGNPQKVQRYARDWAAAFRTMAQLDAGSAAARARTPHRRRGSRAAGADRRGRAARVVARPDADDDERGRAPRRHRAHGARTRALARASVLAGRCTTSRNSSCATSGACTAAGTTVIRRTSSPRRPGRVAEELAALAGGALRLAERAREIAAEGDLRLAGHLAEMAAQAAPDDKSVHEVRAEIFGARAREEASTMSKGVFSWAEHESRQITGSAE